MEIYFVANYSIDNVQSCSIEYVYEYCKTKSVLGIDIETTKKYKLNTYKNEDIYPPGLDPYLSKVIMLQIGDLSKTFVIDTRYIDISILLPLFKSKTRLFVGHNLKFESKHLKHNYGIVFHKIWDTMVVEMILTNGLQLGYSLAKLSERHLGIKNQVEVDLFTVIEDDEVFIDKSIRMEFLNIEDKPFSYSQVTYGAGDIEYPLLIKSIQEKGFGEYCPSKLFQMENEFCLVLADIELKGLHFDKEQWLKVAAEEAIVLERRLNKINDYVSKTYPKFNASVDLFNNVMTCAIQWTSSQQVVELFKYIGICPKEKSKQTKKLEYTVGSAALSKLLPKEYKDFLMSEKETEINSNEDLILNYLLLNKSYQATTTFGEEFLKYVHPITGRLHTSYRQILNTGRISSNNPNCQNIPSKKQYRMCFTAPINHILINCDYAAQESRDLAEISGDQAMLDFFNLGHPVFKDDYHSFTATKMFQILRNDPNLIVSKKTHPEERQAAKNISFKIAYGGGAYTLKDDFGVEEEVAQEFIDSYFNAFPSLKEDFEQAKKKAVELGYIEIDPITGRRWFFKDFEYMKSLSEKAWSFYPKDYRKYSSDQKEIFKKRMSKEHPELKDIWSEYFSLKSSLERKALNFRRKYAA